MIGNVLLATLAIPLANLNLQVADVIGNQAHASVHHINLHRLLR